jgi:excisionase family DNA binding protein
MDKDFYSVKEFALKLGVSSRTIWRAIKNGRINAFHVGSSSRSSVRIAHSEIARMAIVDLEKLIEDKIKERFS